VRGGHCHAMNCCYRGANCRNGAFAGLLMQSAQFVAAPAHRAAIRAQNLFRWAILNIEYATLRVLQFSAVDGLAALSLFISFQPSWP
jgi:hypothetical protein